MKILFHSGAPWAGTGYGVQTALFTPRLRDLGHKVEISATWGSMGDTLEWDGIPVYPADDRYGNATLAPLYDRVKPDVLITLHDVFVLNPQIAQGRTMACWAPVDHDPCPPKVTQFFKDSGARPIAMSRFGERALKDAGLDPLYVPHGVDTAAFRPASNRDEVRDALGIPRDGFVAGMVANNQGHSPPRKAFPQALQAFAEFRQAHTDAVLFLHTEMGGNRSRGPARGIDLFGLLERFEIPLTAVRWTDQLQLELGVPTEYMAGLYNALDVLLMPSYGEGFGVPIIEAQACGTPVIVTDWTSMPELCGSGWIVGGEPIWHALPEGCADSFWMAPRVGGIAEALKQAYEKRGDEVLRAQARAFALGYDADLVTETYWMPVLEALTRPREVPPLNRAMRRAAAKATA